MARARPQFVSPLSFPRSETGIRSEFSLLFYFVAVYFSNKGGRDAYRAATCEGRMKKKRLLNFRRLCFHSRTRRLVFRGRTYACEIKMYELSGFLYEEYLFINASRHVMAYTRSVATRYRGGENSIWLCKCTEVAYVDTKYAKRRYIPVVRACKASKIAKKETTLTTNELLKIVK